MTEPTSRTLCGRGAGCLKDINILISIPTSLAPWGMDAGCFSNVVTYLLGTMEKGCRLFKRCQNLPPGHCGTGSRQLTWNRNPPPMYCGAGVQSGLAVSEPTSQSLWDSGAGCFSGVRTYLPGTVGQGCMHCGASVQAI